MEFKGKARDYRSSGGVAVKTQRIGNHASPFSGKFWYLTDLVRRKTLFLYPKILIS